MDDPTLARAAIIAMGQKLGIDVREVIRFPLGNGAPVRTVRIRDDMWYQVTEFVGRGTRFKDHSDFVRHYFSMGLLMERAMSEDPGIDPVLIRLEQERMREIRDSIDVFVREAEQSLHDADGPEQVMAVKKQIVAMRDYCIAKQLTNREERLNAILSRVGEPVFDIPDTLEDS